MNVKREDYTKNTDSRGKTDCGSSRAYEAGAECHSNQTWQIQDLLHWSEMELRRHQTSAVLYVLEKRWKKCFWLGVWCISSRMAVSIAWNYEASTVHSNRSWPLARHETWEPRYEDRFMPKSDVWATFLRLHARRNPRRFWMFAWKQLVHFFLSWCIRSHLACSFSLHFPMFFEVSLKQNQPRDFSWDFDI